MAEDHGAREARQFSRVWTRDRRETGSRQRGAAQRVCSWTVQNEMRGVLGRGSTDAARKIINYANPREIRA